MPDSTASNTGRKHHSAYSLAGLPRSYRVYFTQAGRVRKFRRIGDANSSVRSKTIGLGTKKAAEITGIGTAVAKAFGCNRLAKE